ncbi:MAG: D-alanine--D-alanine ligase [Gammaproteobacteria bacterium]
MTDFGKVAVLMGGPSAEREVSLKSGNAVLAALKRRGVDAEGIDAERDIIERLTRGGYARAFIALHGRWGEDGVIQGALEVIGLPYTGSGVMASALGMDKLRCKQLWKGAGVATPAYEVLTGDSDFSRVVKRLGLPLFVKPAREGSSFGISKVTDASQLEAAWAAAAKYDDIVIAERGIVGQELTIGILGEQALPVIRLQPAREFYDYEAKYILDTTVYHCPSGLSPTDERRVQRLALAAFSAVGCSGWGRVDVMRDADGRAYALELNTVPGMTDHSLVPKAAKAAGIDFDELVVRILQTSEVRR